MKGSQNDDQMEEQTNREIRELVDGAHMPGQVVHALGTANVFKLEGSTRLPSSMIAYSPVLITSATALLPVLDLGLRCSWALSP